MKTYHLGFLLFLVTGNLPLHSQEMKVLPIPGQDTPSPAGGRVIAEVLGQQIVAEQRDQMSGIIFAALLEEYMKANKIEPTDEEILAFLVKDQEMEKETKAEMESHKKRLTQELASDYLDNEKRAKKEEELKEIDSRLAEEGNQKDGGVERRKMLRDMASQMVSRWKINSSLYQKYGGLVIFQQAGPEPLDAYRDFLKEQESKKKFKIMDEKDRESFWKYFISEDIHSVLPKEEGAKLMRTPWWMMEKP